MIIQNKLILIDWMAYVHRAAHACAVSGMDLKYTILAILISNLKRIGVSDTDTFLICSDGRNSWRKAYEKQYKENRAKLREESGIDWERIFEEAEIALEEMEIMGFNVIVRYGIEADDIVSVVCRTILDKDIIILSPDSDFEQLWINPKVMLFSPMKKCKSKKGAWKIKPQNFNPYKSIAAKIRKEKADNLTSEVLTEEDYEKRKLCVSLLQLPEFVEAPIKEALLNITYENQITPSYFGRLLEERWFEIYKEDDVLTYEQTLAYNIKKEKRIKKSKIFTKDEQAKHMNNSKEKNIMKPTDIRDTLP